MLLTGDFTFEFTYITGSNVLWALGVMDSSQSNPQTIEYYSREGAIHYMGTNYTVSLSNNTVVKLVKTGTTMKIYFNNVEVLSQPFNLDNIYMAWKCYSNRWSKIKDLKVY